MPINQALADAFIGSGVAFDTLDYLVYTGMSEQAILDRLIRRAGGPSNMDYDTAVYVLRRYTLYRNAGLRIQNRNDNSTAGQQFLPNVPGCTGKYEYVAVVPFFDPSTNRSFTKPFTIASDVLLGKADIIAQAQALAIHLLTLPNYRSDAGAAEEAPYQTGEIRVTAAARCTP